MYRLDWPAIDEDCQRCGKPFYPHQDGADGYLCKTCIPLWQTERDAYLRIHGNEKSTADNELLSDWISDDIIRQRS